MKSLESKREKNIDNIISVVKLSALLLSGIIIIQGYFARTVKIEGTSGTQYVSMLSLVIVTTLIAAIYTMWFLVLKRKLDMGKGEMQRVLVIENIIFMMIFMGLILLSGAHVSQYKFLFLFIIIPTTIQLGMKQGLICAAVSSTIVLGIDLIHFSDAGVNPFFENDLIMVAVFLLTAWPLGYYVTVESEHRENLLYLANVDGLTEVYNHRFFQEKLKETLKLSIKSNFPFSLLILDIDHFKYYNDLYGHQMGDYLLKKIGEILRRNVREGDVVSRYGGEEFTVILPFTSKEKAIKIAERIRLDIEQTEFEGEENQPNGRVTASFGVASFPENARNEVELIKSADDALYRAKFFNKNRVEGYYSVLEELKIDIEDEHIDLITSIKTLISVINAKDRYTYGHVERVVTFSKLIAEKLGLSEEDKKLLKYGAYLHDIGKINTPKEILVKKMPLSNDEWEILKQHPANGVQIIKSVDFLKETIPIILYHHERYDGKGYPEGIKGKTIPYLSRILTVTDCFDAMTTNRPYNERKTWDEAFLELERCIGTQFDPDITRAFIEVVKENRDKFEELT
jgi:diguanylate cyclase (GGDEF)-like protein/putative nucleotidyltransferase with HDIG domain